MSYVPFYEDRPYPRMGKLAPAGNVQFDDAAGSIASTAQDMTLYIQMFLNQGQAHGGRIVSEEALALMSKPHVKAEEFGPTASYGYGIAVDTLDGHHVLRHTGGMPSFASAIVIDLDGGVGAFASINAMQGYRPTQVVQYAVQLQNAAGSSKAVPASPTIDDPSRIANGADYIGTYVAADGKKIAVSGDKQLVATMDGRSVPLQHADGDVFITDDPQYARYPFEFGRAKPPEPDTPAEAKPDAKPAPPPVVELSHGPAWYRNDRYAGPTEFHPPEHYKVFTGYYYASGTFPLEAEIFLRKGELWMGGAFRLVPVGDNEFAAEGAPERIEFLFLVGGKARLMKFAGADLWRFERT
jgi:hypothetical protein